ncbi:MAG: ABC transporter permease subunit [Candidatus Heimdallarchaeota archaeon]|nr:ABC transporter permease subunit [Candidatus Heimdallarchaeota archaeon]
MSGNFQNSMKSLFLLLWDEFKGYAKSKTIIALWIGMPLVVIIIHLLSTNQGDFPITIFSGFLIMNIGGLLAAVILSSTMTNEITKNVYAMFLIRPVKRWHLIISKYLAFMFALTIASFLSFAVGIIMDLIKFSDEISSLPEFFNQIMKMSFENLLISLAAMSIACAAGLLIGMLVKSVAMSVILSIYLGQQMSQLAVLPGFFLENIDPLYFSLGIGFAATVVILALGIFIFQRKQF